ncbi:MAG: helix-turn-helix transcriptional regulator [Coriobacteriia bacterium]|nr:helix-turn-helix transcriptional regulator [Coriobacteriia bacterium]
MGGKKELCAAAALCLWVVAATMLDYFPCLIACPAIAAGIALAVARSLRGDPVFAERTVLTLEALALGLLAVAAVGALLPTVVKGVAWIASFTVGSFASASAILAQAPKQKAPSAGSCLRMCGASLLLPLVIVFGFGLRSGDDAEAMAPLPACLSAVLPVLVLLAGLAVVFAAAWLRQRDVRTGIGALILAVALGALALFALTGRGRAWGYALPALTAVSVLIASCVGRLSREDRASSEEALIGGVSGAVLGGVFLCAGSCRGVSLYSSADQVGPRPTIAWLLVALCVLSWASELLGAPRRAESCRDEKDAAEGLARQAVAYLGLSSREADVACFLLQGATVKQTAAELGVSAGTVATYRRRVFDKAGVRGAGELRAKLVSDASGAGAYAGPGCRAIPVWALAPAAALLFFAFQLGLRTGSAAAMRTGLDNMRPLVALGMLAGAAGARLMGWTPMGARRGAICLALLAALASDVMVAQLQYPAAVAGNDFTWAFVLAAGAASSFGACAALGFSPARQGECGYLPISCMASAVAAGVFGLRGGETLSILGGDLGSIAAAAVLTAAAAVLAASYKGREALLGCYLVGCLLGHVSLLALPTELTGGLAVVRLLLAAALCARARVSAGRVRDWGKRAGGAAPGKEEALAAVGLTEAERIVCDLLAQGMTVPQIADKLLLSRSTVATQKKAVYRKMGVHSQAELIERVMSLVAGDGAPSSSRRDL